MLGLQLLANALALGSAYALVAFGFVLVLNATSAVNFAQGDLVTAGGFAAVALASLLPVPGVFLLPLALLLMAGLGLLLSAVAYFPLRSRSPVPVFLSTIAAGVVIQNTLTIGFGPEPRAGPPLVQGGSVEFGGIVVGRQALAVILIALLLYAGLHLLLNRTQLGRRLRATAEDREMAEALGIRVAAMLALAFALAGASAGAAGLLLANSFFVAPGDGGNYMVKAYIAAAIGGWGRIGGAALGAMLIALFEVMFPALPSLLAVGDWDWLFSQTAAALILYASLILILAFRPKGLFGERVGLRA
jgi:branched-chain amino acid transport system permease protein